MTDPETGAELLLLTTNPADDTNLYYEQRLWLADSSSILFNSARSGAVELVARMRGGDGTLGRRGQLAR